MAQRHIGLASREVCRLSQLVDQFQRDAGRKRRLCRSREAASENPAAHSPVDTRTVPLNTGEAAARRRSNVSTASSTLSADATSSSPAALRRNPSGYWPAKSGLERG